MILLVLFAFIAGVVTILSPCILPILPIILSSSFAGQSSGKSRPFGIVFGFIASFTFFTLFLSAIVNALNIPADSLRIASIVIIALFGLSLLIPQFQAYIERLFSKLSSAIPTRQNNPGFWGGFLLGMSLGLLWTPCVGPILASVISLAISGTVSFSAFIITFFYSLGTAIPMFFIIYGGQNVLQRNQWLLRNTAKIQKAFGVIMIITALGIYNNVDRTFQTYILEKFPQYGSGLTNFENNSAVLQEINALRDTVLNGKSNDVNKRPNPNTPINTNTERLVDYDGIPSFNLDNPGPLAPEIIPGGEWFNTEPLTIESLRGKVVLVDFWTYSCINCQRTLPYLRDWWSKYKDQGLVIIGVHTPEFAFEKEADNVAQALKDFDITYPVVQDNNSATFYAYDNLWWPAKYLIDKDGKLRYHHIGEHSYAETEAAIQELLLEAGATNVKNVTINNQTYTIETNTPESYLGYKRIMNVASGPLMKDVSSEYFAPPSLPLNYLAFDGVWNVREEHATSTPGSSLLLHFESKGVYLVMNASETADESGAQVDIYIDDTFVKSITVTKDTLYPLIEFEKMEDHILRLDFPEGNVEVFAFTFG